MAVGSKAPVWLQCWISILLLVISQRPQLFVNSETLMIEVDIDESVLTVFEADLSLPDFGAAAFCKERNAAPECVPTLKESIIHIIETRKHTPQTTYDELASSELHSAFSDPDACTDNFHVCGRCLQLRSLARYVLRNSVPGDYVEAGVHIGDSAAAISRVFLEGGSKKKLYLYDSFAGMPEADLNIDGSYAISLSPSNDDLGRGWGHEASAEGVLKRLTNLGMPKERVIIREGWFNETFHTPPTPHHLVSLLMIDGDWYDSVYSTLVAWYDKVPPGGVIVIDDYGYWEGARKALGDFLRARPDIEMPLFERYGPDILWWVKGNQHNRPS